MIQTPRRFVHRNLFAIPLLIVLCCGIGYIPTPSYAQNSERCFPGIVDDCIKNQDILTFWDENGDIEVFGYPITEDRIEDIGGELIIFQWFQRHCIELHPKEEPYNVQLGLLGIQVLERQGIILAETFPMTKEEDTPSGCRFFRRNDPGETHAFGYYVCEPFRTYWETHGVDLGLSPDQESLYLFGQPISNPLQEVLSNGQYHTVQWFERARFEHHPANSSDYHVLLGLLGNEIIK